MIRDWQGTARALIREIDAKLPANATLAERKKALGTQARPYEFNVTSWGRKTWQKAQREYLAKFNRPKSDAAVPPEHLSPLERMMARAKSTI